MSACKINSLAKALLISGCAAALGACSTVSNTWGYFTDENDSSLKTPTGYYEHAYMNEYADPLKVPANIDKPYQDNSLEIPNIDATNDARMMVGANMDVRPPVVSQVKELGTEISNFNGSDAVAWFLPYGNLNVYNEEQAWNMINAALNYLKIPVEQSDANNFTLTTKAFDFNQFGEPYSVVNDDFDNLRYRQAYKIEIGRASNYGLYSQNMNKANNFYQGQVGFQVSLVSSQSMYSNGDAFEEQLNARQKSSFTVGFANSIVKALAEQNKPQDILPDNLDVVLGLDNNKQDAFIANIPYTAAWNIMHGLLNKYGFEIIEYSVSGSSYRVDYNEEAERYYQEANVRPMYINEDEYFIRLAVSGDDKTVITFYDAKDKPLSGNVVATLYQGFSQALAKEYALYKSNPSAYVAQFAQEE